MDFTAEPSSINVMNSSIMPNSYTLLRVYAFAGEKKVTHIKHLPNHRKQN